MLLRPSVFWWQIYTVWIHLIEQYSEIRPFSTGRELKHLRVQLFDDTWKLIQFRCSWKDWSSWYKLCQDTTSRPNINLLVVVWICQPNFRRSVELSDDLTCIWCWYPLSFRAMLVLHKISCKTEICILEFTFCIYQNVLTLYISMNDSILMHENKSFHYLLENEFYLKFCKCRVLLSQKFVKIKLHKLKYQIDCVALTADNIDQLDYIRVFC